MEVVGCCARMSVEVAHGSGGAGFYSDGSGGSGAWQQQNGLALDVLGLRQGHVLRVLVTAMWRSSNGGASYHLGEATGAS
ncbi:hypothetical protein RHGRI_004248 [Rhododendron griersonianum]|uniref:Uncharacterized protein n=1 Tax=Rhododendron griersonianum TaxID=479676 RepID=A0AAV6L7Y1_9ERIC|nr:hypothetical protein RHGRI_004248 [Rhododendron griersonianum]